MMAFMYWVPTAENHDIREYGRWARGRAIISGDGGVLIQFESAEARLAYRPLLRMMRARPGEGPV